MTKEQIKRNAEEYADENNICICDEEYWSYDDLVKAHIAGAESRQPEIDYGKELIRDILISINGTYLPNISEDTKELLKEAAFYVGVKIEV